MSGEELAFVKAQVNALSHIRVTYPNDFQPALEDVPRKVPPFNIALAPPPAKKAKVETTSSGFSITVKSTKPALSFPLANIQPSDTILQVKSILASTHLKAPAADQQRLLLKGKVLADTKLVKEYDIGNDTVLTLMTKPGSSWNGEERSSQVTSSTNMESSAPPIVSGAPLAAPQAKPALTTTSAEPPSSSHGRQPSIGQADQMEVPALILSPSPSPSSSSPQRQHAPPVDLKLDTDLNNIPEPPKPHQTTQFHSVIASPEFWIDVQEFLEKKFNTNEDVKKAMETFFLASKNALSPHEIAKIVDTTGVITMGGR